MNKPICANPWDYECPESFKDVPNQDEILVETAGFVPLDIRFKMMEEAGIRAQFRESEFDSADMRAIYEEHPEFAFTMSDELEDIERKIALRNKFITELYNKRNPPQADEDVKDDASSKERATNKANDKQDGSTDV